MGLNLHFGVKNGVAGLKRSQKNQKDNLIMSVCLLYPGEHPRFRDYFGAILDIIMRYLENYSISNTLASP